MTINIPDSARTAFDGNMQNSTAVELPFPAPPFYILNGNARLEQVGGVHFFGGWACNTDKFQPTIDHWEGRIFPIPGISPAQTILENGTKLDVHAARNLFVAPIGMRQFSTIENAEGRKQRVAPFTKGARPGIQFLCMLGYRDPQKVIQAWAPIMLTASGYQVNHLQDAFSNWNKAIKPLVKKLVPDVDPSAVSNLFWMSIGTFGTERKAITVGIPPRQQTITPVTSYIPENLDEEMLKKLYVGEELAGWMATLSLEAKEWLQVFRNMTPAKPVAETVETQYLDEPPPPPDDDIPF
jgi:hypothetical protein